MSAWKSVEAEFFCAQGNIKTTNSCPESLKMLVQNPVHGNFLYESAHFTHYTPLWQGRPPRKKALFYKRGQTHL